MKTTKELIRSKYLTGLCSTQDVDIFIRHMNNARYVRELDFARFHYYGLTGIYAAIKKHGGGAVQGASSVRYRRTIPIFNPVRILQLSNCK
jgi:acyl-CoA thioesterase FadM